MKNQWEIWKHALGAFDEEDGYNVKNENKIAIVRSLIVLLNVAVGILIMANIINNWGHVC